MGSDGSNRGIWKHEYGCSMSPVYRDEHEVKEMKHEKCDDGRDRMWADGGYVYYKSDSCKEKMDNGIKVRKTYEGNESGIEFYKTN